MTTNHHTPITTGAARTAANINGPLGQLDAEITAVTARLKGTIIEGMKMTWNSATSVTVGVGACYAPNGDWIDVTSALVKSSLSLSVSTWYHIYVYLSSDTPTAEVVTTAPVAWKGTAYSKTGDTSRRYVGSVKADASGNVIPFEHSPITNNIIYKLFQLNVSPFRVLTAGTSSSAAAVSLSGIVPVTSTIAMVRFTNNADQQVRTSENNGVSATQFSSSLPNPPATYQQINFMTHILDSSSQLWYKYDAAVGSGGFYVDVLGYQFER